MFKNARGSKMFVALVESVLIFAAALAVLAKASGVVIDKAMDIARLLNITTFAVGFILLAVGTSLPELVVSALASSQGNVGISVGNVVGSNVADLTLVLGLSALFGTIVVKKKWVSSNAGILLTVAVLPLLLFGAGKINLVGGLLLLGAFVAYCFVLFRQKEKHVHLKDRGFLHAARTYALFFGGIAVIVFSANYVVSSGVELAGFFGVPQSFIGLTLIALGTSVPEIAVCVAAVRKKHADLAAGNVLGSCVTNLTLVLGTAAVLSQNAINFELFASSTVFLIYLSALVWYFFSERCGVNKKQAFILLASYAAFIAAEVGLVIS